MIQRIRKMLNQANIYIHVNLLIFLLTIYF